MEYPDNSDILIVNAEQLASSNIACFFGEVFGKYVVEILT
jgi:hypothetical protein